MLRSVAAVFLLAGVLMFPQVAAAKLEYETVDSGNGITVLMVSGEFDYGDTLEGFLFQVSQKRPDFVTFDSPGGSIYNAIKLGRLIRGLSLPTIQIRGTECASACALAFFGGSERFAETGSIGVHKSSFAPSTQLGKDEAVSAIQSITADIVDYLIEMGVSPAVLSLALRYEDWDMRYLSQSEMLEMNIITVERDTEQLEAKVNETPAPRRRPETSHALPPQPEVPAPSRTAALTEAEAVQFAEIVVATHTLPSLTALPRLREFYNPTVDYYGTTQSLAAVISDKRDYFDRWPQRKYRILPSTIAVDCSGGEFCTVTGVYSWAVRSEPRRLEAAGTASFEYAFSRSAPYRVLKETSEVIKRQ